MVPLHIASILKRKSTTSVSLPHPPYTPLTIIVFAPDNSDYDVGLAIWLMCEEHDELDEEIDRRGGYWSRRWYEEGEVDM